jgi:enoyl-CoA hydratase
MEDSKEEVLYETKDKVALITLNRPHKRNALGTETVKKLRVAWTRFESDPEARVAIFTGRGKTFCAGYDLEELGRGIQIDFSPGIPNSGIEVTKPIIGAINGLTFGVGVALAMSCDIKVMAENTRFVFPEAKIGIALGGVDLLNFMPYATAMELYLTGEPLEAKRAYELGIINRAVPEEQVMPEAMRFADLIKNNAPLTMKMLKMFAIQHTLTVRSAWIQMESRYIKPQLESEDLKEGARAFKEKRKPVFKGR